MIMALPNVVASSDVDKLALSDIAASSGIDKLSLSIVVSHKIVCLFSCCYEMCNDQYKCTHVDHPQCMHVPV